jgi:GNAT superfamily N-acetyltransferase
MRIAFLADHPEHAATLAAWHHAQWGHLFRDWTATAALAELQHHCTRRTCPTTLIAFSDDGTLCGSASLLDDDAEELRGYGGPWLASVYVRDDARGDGTGTALVRAVVAQAAREGHHQVLLFTTMHAPYYEQLGWHLFDRAALNGHDVDLMRIVPRLAMDGSDDLQRA